MENSKPHEITDPNHLSCSLGAVAAQAAEQNPAEAKLRESLRNTMLQMRTLQGERDTLQAEKDQAEAAKKALGAEAGRAHEGIRRESSRRGESNWRRRRKS